MSDTISRQTAIDAIIKADYEITGILSEPRARRFEQTINDLPSAQPEREPAKFIRWMECKKTDKYISYTPHCKCSKCGNELLIEAINYCYMCGARMEGERRTNEPD